jgi:CRISPR-associated endonuclease/helicase Cas3
MARSTDNHGCQVAVSIREEAMADKTKGLARLIRERCLCNRSNADRRYLDWVTALTCESVPEGASQLQIVRRNYLLRNLRSILARTTSEHLRRALFAPWDYADALENQSLHWEPSEDRRHAYQWYMPSDDPTRSQRGGMLGANRLALEAWPLFPSFPAGDRVATRGFKGSQAADTFWTWPLWRQPLTDDAAASILALPDLLAPAVDPTVCRSYGMFAVFRVQRIVAGQTRNLTTAMAMA